jgi:hypothetical protein
MAVCELFLTALHHYSCFCINDMTLFMYFIKHALKFCKVRIKLLGLTFKGKWNIFPNQQPLSSPTITLPHTYITKQLWCLLPFILNRNHWFAHWLSKDCWLLRKLSCLSCCPCCFTHSECEKQWIYAWNVMHTCWIITDKCPLLDYLMYSMDSKMWLLC